MKLLEKETNTYWEALLVIANNAESLNHAKYIARSALSDGGWGYDKITKKWLAWHDEDENGGGIVEPSGEIIPFQAKHGKD